MARQPHWPPTDTGELISAVKAGGLVYAIRRLPARPPAELERKARMLRLWPRAWTNGEVEIARDLAGHSLDELVAALVGRTADEVAALVEEQGIATTAEHRVNTRWTKSELVCLRAHFPVGGAVGAGVHLLGRLPGEVQAKADELGLVQLGVEWTQAEDDALRSGYHEHGASGLQKFLPGRSISAIKNRAQFHGLVAPVDPAVAEETARRSKYLIANEGLLTAVECAKELGISVQSVRGRARAIGVSFLPARTPLAWSDNDQVLARSLFYEGGWERLLGAFPHLGLRNLTTLVRTLRLTSDLVRDGKVWTSEERLLLEERGGTLGLRTVAGLLQRNPSSVAQRARDLRIDLGSEEGAALATADAERADSTRSWLPHEIAALTAAVYSGGIAQAVSACAGRSVAEVLHQATKQGIWPRVWTPGELDELTRWWGAPREMLLERVPGREYDDMWNVALMLGIGRTDWWGPFAVRQVFELYPGSGSAGVHSVLRERTVAMVDAYVEAVGLNTPGALQWSSIDDDRLRWAVAAGGLDEAIATLRDRDPRVVRARATALGFLLEDVVRPIDPRRAPRKTVDFIREAAATSSAAGIATALGLTSDEVRVIGKAFNVSLPSDRTRHYSIWTSEEETALVKAWCATEGMSRAARELACSDALPGRTMGSIDKRARDLGLRAKEAERTGRRVTGAIEAYVRDMTLTETNSVIAAKFGVSERRVSEARKRVAGRTAGT